MQLELQENGDDVDYSDKNPHLSSITMSVAFSEVSPQLVTSLNEGHEDPEMDFEMCARLPKKLTSSESAWIDSTIDTLVSDIFEIPGLTTSEASSAPDGTDDVKLVSSLPSVVSFFEHPDSIFTGTWHSELLSDDVATTTIESTFEGNHYSPSSNAVSQTRQGIWRQELLPTESPLDKFNNFAIQSLNPNQKPRRTRRQIKPILGPGPNKYGRSGKPRCEVCRSRKQKVCHGPNEPDCSASMNLSSSLANFALSDKLRAIKFGGQNDNFRAQANWTSY